MTIEGSSIAVPGGTSLAGAVDGGGVVLRERASLAVFDLATEALSPWRAFAGLRQARGRGAWIVVQDAGGDGLVRGDLQGDVVRWTKRFSVAGVSGDRALVTERGTWKLIDLAEGVEVATGSDTASWNSVHDGLFLGVRERTREIVGLRSRDGAIAWTATPFAKKVDSIGHPCGRGDEVHVRARGARGGLVARLAATDGAMRGLRDAPPLLDSWLPDLGEVVDRALVSFKANGGFVEGDALVTLQSNQAIVVRATGTARVALPALSGREHGAGRIAGIVSDREQCALVVVPLPVSGEHDLVLLPRADVSVEPVVSGKVSFASGAVVIVQHPVHGRATLVVSGKQTLPKAGDDVVLDGVTVKPGGVLKVERWWTAGPRAAREPVRVALVQPVMRVAPPSVPSQLAGDLLVRSRAAGIAVVPELLCLVERADEDASFRDALGRLGFRFGEPFNGASVVDELEIEGFLPVWGDGNGDTFGGVTAAGELAYLQVRDDQAVRALPPLFDHLRAEAAESEQESSAALILEVLSKLG